MSKPRLILPVENQVRELDAKLLLAAAASVAACSRAHTPHARP